MDEMRSIWELYGLKANPFSTDPLLVKGGIIPIDCFYGRREEGERLEKQFRSEGGSRILVIGSPGVGKTTFVNFSRAKAIKNKFFSPFQEIKAQPDWNADDFILNSLSAIYSTLKLLDEKEISERLKPVVDFYEIKNRQGSLGANYLTIGGSVGYGETKSIHHPALTSSALLELFQQTIAGLKKSGYREVIIHYNNIELFEEDETRLKSILNKIRDFLQTPNVHFVFVGSESLPSICQSIPRVSAIIQDTPIKLSPLSKEDVQSVIQKRIDVLKIPGLFTVSPCTNDAIFLLYNLHDGNIRAILNSLSTAVLEIVKDAPVTLDEQQTKIVLNSVAKKRFTSQLSPTVQKVLHELLIMKNGTNTMLSKKLDMKPQNMSSYLKELSKSGCIFLVKSEGKEKFYAVSDWVKWLTLEPDKTTQAKLDRFA